MQGQAESLDQSQAMSIGVPFKLSQSGSRLSRVGPGLIRAKFV